MARQDSRTGVRRGRTLPTKTDACGSAPTARNDCWPEAREHRATKLSTPDSWVVVALSGGSLVAFDRTTSSSVSHSSVNWGPTVRAGVGDHDSALPRRVRTLPTARRNPSAAAVAMKSHHRPQSNFQVSRLKPSPQLGHYRNSTRALLAREGSPNGSLTVVAMTDAQRSRLNRWKKEVRFGRDYLHQPHLGEPFLAC